MAKAFEPNNRRMPQHSDKWTTDEEFWKDVEDETQHARGKFTFPGCHLENDLHTRSFWLSVITEEIGKLCQCVNKLKIAKDEGVRDQWVLEGYHRIITSASLLRRLAENWHKMPDEGGILSEGERGRKTGDGDG